MQPTRGALLQGYHQRTCDSLFEFIDNGKRVCWRSHGASGVFKLARFIPGPGSVSCHLGLHSNLFCVVERSASFYLSCFTFSHDRNGTSHLDPRVSHPPEPDRLASSTETKDQFAQSKVARSETDQEMGRVSRLQRLQGVIWRSSAGRSSSGGPRSSCLSRHRR